MSFSVRKLLSKIGGSMAKSKKKVKGEKKRRKSKKMEGKKSKSKVSKKPSKKKVNKPKKTAKKKKSKVSKKAKAKAKKVKSKKKVVKKSVKKAKKESKKKTKTAKAKPKRKVKTRKKKEKKTSKKRVEKKTKKTTKKKATKGKRKKEVKKGKEKKVKKKKKEVEEEIIIKKIEPEESEGEEIKGEERRITIEEPEEYEKPEEGIVSESKEIGTGEAEIQKETEITPEMPAPEKRSSGMRCPDCGSTNLRWDYERGELICEDCGMVIEESLIDFGPEWRAFDSYQKTKRQRTGSPVKYTKPNKGLVTEIDRYNRDIRGTKLSPQAASQMGRLRKWHRRSSVSSSIERNLTIALGDLDRIASYLRLPANIKEAAALLYRKAVEKGLIRGRLIESVVAAVVYMVCRQYGIPRTLDEITEVSQVSKKEIGRTYRFLKKELYVDVPLTNPIYYVPRFASALGLSGKVQEKAKEILQEAINKGLISGRGPTGVAAAAVYIASVMTGERRTQKEVAEVAGVTEVTIRNRYRELKRELGLAISGEDEE